jgi:PAS domain S-box-containing protein
MFVGMNPPAVSDDSPLPVPREPHEPHEPHEPSGHIVQFYEKDGFLIDRLAGFLAEGCRQGEAAVAVITRAHRMALLQELPEDLREDSARLLLLDAEELLENLTAEGMPDRERFRAFLEGILSRVEAGDGPVRLFGEMVALLWNSGAYDEALALEALWEEEIRGRRIRVLCAYPLQSFQGARHRERFRHICDRHTRVLPSESLASPDLTEDDRMRALVLLQQKALDLEGQALEMTRRVEERARHFAAIVKSSNDAIVSKDLESRVLSWNRAAEAIFGYSESEMIGRSITVLIPSHLQDEESLILGRIRRGESLEHYETVRQRKDGTLIDISLTVSPILDDEGKVVGASKIARDITDRKRIEAALGESESRFRSMADSAPVFIWMADESGACTYFNRYHMEFSGRPVEQELGDGWFGLVHPEDLEQCRSRYSAGIASKGPFRMEYRLKRRDGAYRWVLDSASPRLSEQGVFLGFIGCGMDITEHKATEEQLRQSQKMDAVGRLAGGIAHDFNNLLTSINGFTDLALAAAPTGSPLMEYLQEVSKSGARAANLTSQLLAYSRKQVLAPKIIDLNAVVADMDRMLNRLIGEELRVITRLYPGLGRVKADPGQMQQILVNLVLNARDAMAGGGDVTIETANVVLGQDFTATHLEGEPGPCAMLAVRDTGCGMTPEVQSRLFEPFFTTKAVGKGTGLGLSSVYGIVKQSGGCISVETAPGRGSVFRIFLPLEATDDPRSPDAPPKKAEQGSGTLLLAEDEETVRKFLAATLRNMGFQVLEAGDGSQALALAREGRNIDCLVTDIVMPGMSGSKLASELRAGRPRLPVLFISGYARDMLSAAELADPGAAFLQKPFSPQELVSKIRELIAARR